MIQVGRKVPKSEVLLTLEEKVSEQQLIIQQQANDISDLKSVVDDLILNSTGGKA